MIIEVGIGTFVGLFLIIIGIIIYDKINHRRLIKNYEPEKIKAGKFAGERDRGVETTDFSSSATDFSVRYPEVETVSDNIDGKSVGGKQKDSKFTRNPFKRRRK